MSSFNQKTLNPDKIMYCPYNPSHKVKASLFYQHILEHQGYVSLTCC